MDTIYRRKRLCPAVTNKWVKPTLMMIVAGKLNVSIATARVAPPALLITQHVKPEKEA